MGRFETEIDLLTHSNIKECLRKCKLIGPNDDPESLKKYADNMLQRFIKEQMQYFPNSQRVIDLWIITTFNLFRKIIIEDSLPISEMPPVQLSTLLATTENAIKEYAMRKKVNSIEAVIKEIQNDNEMLDIPSKDQLINATLINQIEWDPINSLIRNPIQNEDSFKEQKLAITTCVNAIDQYIDPSHDDYVKNVGIRGFPGAGKTWCMMYCKLYAMSKGLKVTTTAIMCKRALQLGGTHLD